MSMLTSYLYEQARRSIARSTDADPNYHEILFCANTTAAVNKAARILSLNCEDIVLISDIEHSSNDLPWRRHALLKRYRVDADCTVNLEALRAEIRAHLPRLKLVCLTGASNITGYIPPIASVAALCHEHSVPLFLDAAQLAPHHPLHLCDVSRGVRIDFAAFSGHKLGAPYGTGVLVAPRQLLEASGVPSDEPGGGTTDILTEERAYWTSSPDRFEGGTPNAIGAVAFAKAMETLTSYGWERLEKEEQDLWQRAVRRLETIQGVDLYVRSNDDINRTPVIPFNIRTLPHGLTAAALGFEHGIGLRHGRLCADSLILRLLNISRECRAEIIRAVAARGLKADVYGVVRASIGFANTTEDVDRLCEAVAQLAQDGPFFQYVPQMTTHPTAGRQTNQTGEYWPVGLTTQEWLDANPLPDTLSFLE